MISKVYVGGQVGVRITFILLYHIKPDCRLFKKWNNMDAKHSVQLFDANIDYFFEQNPHLEIDGQKSIEMMQRPGGIKTHLPLHRVPYDSQAKYICVIRNPKDVCISYYIFYNMWPHVPKLKFDQFFEYFMEEYLPFGDYFQALRSAWGRRHDGNVLLVSYEEMRTDFQSIIHKVSLQKTKSFSGMQCLK
jgi:hypothetical protein